MFTALQPDSAATPSVRFTVLRPQSPERLFLANHEWANLSNAWAAYRSYGMGAMMLSQRGGQRDVYPTEAEATGGQFNTKS